ncbi:uncharacterized protein PAN0_009c3781 [Moesziomyces antarcticus]|uniref:Uncharacterized protein n=2 Tax=Pseudozyma antarctica TaxID=84753 RepID=A0A5C3FQ67_PSEA2|nr:uncharacterized protein PAN0_009c3781 [Moesziomyces antarcticus]GAK65564.1 conserved hypothetical protein [Moesziomyces antarcticus]SPO46574.1 uncharacterized protein PSANT_04260 [Moesziomyces antarcticus]
MTSTVGGGHEATELDVEALAEELSRSSIHDPVGHLLVRLDDAQGYDRLPQPTLPPEVLERVVRHIQPDVLVGDPVAYITLVRLSCVSRLMRHWALEALYSVIILPRHVREFRKWYSRSVKSQPAFQFAGYSRALFSGLDDVSRLTSFSAGWDHELLRLLHYCGPTLTHLSLWRSESMALLRDPGQVREGYRFGTSQPVQVWGDKEADAEVEVADDEDDGFVAPPEAAHADDLFSKEELDDMPGWLQAEIRLQGTRAVTIRHKAHLTPTRRITRRQQGCQPTHLSIMMSLPLLEHEDPKVFPRMLIWHRVQELDVHISTPGHTPRILRLLASLRESPIRRLRISTSFSSLCMMTPPFPPSRREQEARENGEELEMNDRSGTFAAESPYGSNKPALNLCDALTSILRDEVLRGVLIDELQGKPHTAVAHLEHLMLRCCLDGPNRRWSSKPDCVDVADPSTPASAFDTQARSSSRPAWAAGRASDFRLTITRGNQALWAKLKDRLWDFRQRAEGLSEGSWEMLS